MAGLQKAQVRLKRSFARERLDLDEIPEKSFHTEKAEMAKKSFDTEKAEMSGKRFSTEKAEMSEKSFQTEKDEKSKKRYNTEKAEVSEKKCKTERFSTPLKNLSQVKGFDIHEAYLRDNAEHYLDPKTLSSPVASDGFLTLTGTSKTESPSSVLSSSAEDSQQEWLEDSQPLFY
jgi:hypothetical protein